MIGDLRASARALDGDVVGRKRILAPGPGHSRKDRSLQVTFDPDAPEGFWVRSYAGDPWPVCRDHVRAALGLPAWSPRSGRQAAPVAVYKPRPASRDERGQAEWNQTRALRSWNEAVDPRGTLLETYLLKERGLRLTDDVAGSVLRFHPACPWKDERGVIIHVPVMIAAMRCIRTGRLKAVHRTRLTVNAEKVKPPRMLGDAAGTAIKIDADESVTTGLAISEGVETALAARQLGLRPVWALGSCGAVAKFPILSGIEALTILAETDDNGASARAISACMPWWHAAGREVIVARPRIRGDLNDVLQAAAR